MSGRRLLHTHAPTTDGRLQDAPMPQERGMPDDLLIVLLCELGERIVAMRDLLTEPAVAAKPHAGAVATLLTRGLDAVENRCSHALAVPRAEALRALEEAGHAWRLLHRRLGLLDLRWSAAPLDVGLRKLRDDVGEVWAGALPHPAVVLCDDYDALDEGVAARLRRDLTASGLDAGRAWPAGTAVLALPRLEAANPLSWPLVLPELARLALTVEPSGASDQDEAADVMTLAARLGGPAHLAARAAHALISTPIATPIWPALAPLATATARGAEGLEEADHGGLEEADHMAASFSGDGPIALFARLARERDEVLGHATPPHRPREPRDGGPMLPPPLLPSAAEASALLSKLAGGTPINAIDPPMPGDFLARLTALRDAEGFYALIGPLGERAASLATILGVGWLYKTRYSYPLFRRLLHEHGTLPAALAAYRPHAVERTALLLQSIEAAHVQGIFTRGRLED